MKKMSILYIKFLNYLYAIEALPQLAVLEDFN